MFKKLDQNFAHEFIAKSEHEALAQLRRQLISHTDRICWRGIWPSGAAFRAASVHRN
jgi:DNA-binding GntR family transcriptional regulator